MTHEIALDADGSPRNTFDAKKVPWARMTNEEIVEFLYEFSRGYAEAIFFSNGKDDTPFAKARSSALVESIKAMLEAVRTPDSAVSRETERHG